MEMWNAERAVEKKLCKGGKRKIITNMKVKIPRTTTNPRNWMNKKNHPEYVRWECWPVSWLELKARKLIRRKRTKTISWCKTWCWDKLARLHGKTLFFSTKRSCFCWSKVGNRSSAIPIKRIPVLMTTKGAESISTISFYSLPLQCTLPLNDNDSPFFPLDCCANSFRCEHRLQFRAHPGTFERIECRNRCQPNIHPTSMTVFREEKETEVD